MDAALEQQFLAKLQERYDAFVVAHPLPSTDGKIDGKFSVGVIATGRKGDGKTVRMRISPFDGHHTPLKVPLSPALLPHADECAELAKTFLKDKGLISLSEPLTEQNFLRQLLPSAQAFLATQSDGTPQNDSAPAGLFLERPVLPTGKNNKSIEIDFSFRPTSDYAQTKTTRTAASKAKLIGVQSTDEDHADALMKAGKQALEEMGFARFDIRKAPRGEQARPIEGIEPEHITLQPLAKSDSSYKIKVVRHHDDIRPVYWATGTKDAAKAARMLEILVKDYLPLHEPGRELHGHDITLDSIATFVHERVPKDPRIAPTSYNPMKPRVIKSKEGDKLRIMTPKLVKRRDEAGTLHYLFQLRFAPLEIGDFEASQVGGNLNTSDPVVAKKRMDMLLDLAEVALTEKFAEFPRHTLSVIKEEDARKKIKFAPPPLTGKPLDDQFFFDDLANEVIKPALKDFDRYIYWNVVPPNEGAANTITFDVRRNDGEAYPTGSSLFQGPFTITARTPEAAEQFVRTLNLEMTREQYMFGRERGVDQFGDQSAGVAIRESLRSALQTPGIDLMGSNLLGELQKVRTRKQE